MHKMEIAIASTQVAACVDLAAETNASLYVDERDGKKIPFTALLTTTTDNLVRLRELADVGLYVVCRRVIKPGPVNVISLSPMVHHPDRSHEQCDAHWRDTHAPLALVHHAYMSQYVQLSVVHTISGREFDGFALCGFETLEDLRERFFTTEDSVPVIMADIQNFADTQRSPRPLIARPVHAE